MFGMSFIYVVFDEGTDVYWARSRVLESLSSIQGRLPAGVTPTLGPDATAIGWVYEYALVDRSGQPRPGRAAQPAGLHAPVRGRERPRRGAGRDRRRLREAVPGDRRPRQAPRLRPVARRRGDGRAPLERRGGRARPRDERPGVLRARPRATSRTSGSSSRSCCATTAARRCASATSRACSSGPRSGAAWRSSMGRARPSAPSSRRATARTRSTSSSG